MGIIFDLDQTLIDSSIAAVYRDNREWQKVYSLIPKFRVYPKINELISWLNYSRVVTCVVTNTPRSYCIRVIDHFSWTFCGTVCYHDTKNHKPHPEPIFKGIELLKNCTSNIISVGDQAKDIIASKRAGIVSVAATWGTDDLEALLKVKPDIVCQSVDELFNLIKKSFILS